MTTTTSTPTATQIKVWANREVWRDRQPGDNFPLRHMRVVRDSDGTMRMQVNINGRYKDQARALGL
jgi:hypothetical protein